ncbi:MAG: hypothetical protein GTO45_25140 [Candidatus Aminicenantes bacterium]|nr:hypothetical protein [Candidatus Aminicenantes bacterium]NIM82025.1 hypothetical protein [Candidatus Aminicenantes bacterium]NIN21409.1 hypothetical protein [Candidatus Aminicenantes bacterium]NIN45236.1 hypothetical protein [Candidatus Aminicenantes bacterium]NIN88056.1 hypothetical protein [Candidatus Aminicenantes bacterium]
MRSFRLSIAGVLVVAAGIAALTLTGCQKKVSEEVDQGTIENSVYHNNYFGMSITIPDDWSVLDKKQMEMIANMGKQMVSRDSKKIIEAAEPQSITLLGVFKHPLGTPVPFNPNFMCVAERVRHLPGINRGRDYHYHSRKLMKTSGINIKIVGEIYSETHGGVAFDVMSTEMRLGGTVILQKQYAAIRKGYALLFVISYSTPEQEKLLGNILDTLTFQ